MTLNKLPRESYAARMHYKKTDLPLEALQVCFGAETHVIHDSSGKPNSVM